MEFILNSGCNQAAIIMRGVKNKIQNKTLARHALIAVVKFKFFLLRKCLNDVKNKVCRCDNWSDKSFQTLSDSYFF